MGTGVRFKSTMQKLLKKLAKGLDHEEGWIRIVGADWFDDYLRLDLSIKASDEFEPELWEIECEGVVEEYLSSYEAQSLDLDSNSPLLKPFVEKEIELMFSKNELAPEFLLGVVCSCCTDIMGRSNYVGRFMNLEPTVSGVTSSEYGKLGCFPDTIAKSIVRALKDFPICLSPMPGHEPKFWTGTEFVGYPTLVALEIGESYVIAERFRATHV